MKGSRVNFSSKCGRPARRAAWVAVLSMIAAPGWLSAKSPGPAGGPRGGEPVGACCIGAFCTDLTPSLCANFLGVYLGDGTTCEEIECPSRVFLNPSQDNTLYGQANTTSNGAGDHLFAGMTGAGSPRRALLKFDLDAIPEDATIVSATLTMTLTRQNGGEENVYIHRLLNDWGEGGSNAPLQEGQGAPAQLNDATWMYRFYNPAMPGMSPQWTTLGGDYVETPSAVSVIGIDVGTAYSWTSPALTADVQAWHDGSATNYGWIAIGNELFTNTAKRFNSSENPNPDSIPKLTVYYVAAEPTGACCTGGDCAVVSAAACAGMSGEYQGDATDCSVNPCGPVLGACCLNAGTCQTLTAVDCESVDGVYQGDGAACTGDLCPVVLEPFVDPLPVPEVATPTSGTAGGAATYDIAILEVQQKLHRDLPPTTVWGYDGVFPGPTIEAKSGEPVTVNWINDLRDEMDDPRTDHYLDVDLCPHGAVDEAKTVVHLHGGHVPSAYDGYPEYTFGPGAQETYIYPNDQLPATIWYHDHALGITRLNVYMGLAAFYLIRDDIEASLNLPSGENEIPLAIQDRSFNADGSLQYPAAWTDHFVGDHILVNGAVTPYLEVRRGKHRFRMLNGCGSRTLTLALSNGASMQLIGTDGGLLPAPQTMTEMTLSPAERADVIIDFAAYPAGTQIELLNSAPAPYPGTPGVGVVPNVMRFVVGEASGHTAEIPASLRPIEILEEADAVVTRDFELRKMSEPCAGSEWRINDLGWDDITEQPVLGTTEIWRFINRSGMMHPMHVHLVFFQVLDRQPFTIVDDVVVPTGTPTGPGPTEQGWKDTVQVAPYEMVRVIARFEDYTGLFAYHCHILEHEDHEMMRQFRAVCTRGDTNQDTLINGADIDLFVDTLIGGGEPGTAAYCATDMNGNEVLEPGVDLPMFVDCLLTGNCP